LWERVILAGFSPTPGGGGVRVHRVAAAPGRHQPARDAHTEAGRRGQVVEGQIHGRRQVHRGSLAKLKKQPSTNSYYKCKSKD